MATPTLTAVWLTSAADLTSSIQVQTKSIVESPEVKGDVRVYAGGRLRAVTLAGKPRTIALNLTLVPRATIDQLDAWAGTELLLRDPFGLRRWGVYFTFQRTQHPYPDLSDITLTFNEVTHDEAV